MGDLSGACRPRDLPDDRSNGTRFAFARAWSRILPIVAVALASACASVATGGDTCARNTDFHRRCNPGLSECELHSEEQTCLASLPRVRADYVRALDSCFANGLACSDASVDPFWNCVQTELATLRPTDTMMQAARVVCEQCPMFGGGASDIATCVQYALNPATAPGSGVQVALGRTLREFSDDTLASVIRCVQSQPVPMNCPQVADCMEQPLLGRFDSGVPVCATDAGME